jgi:hypothetical protein
MRLPPDLTSKESLALSHGDPGVKYSKYSIYGTVTGRGGIPISGATVSFRHVESDAAIKVVDRCTTDELGRYYLSEWSLTTPRWILSVDAEGYAPYARPSFELNPDEPRAIEIPLQER